MLEWYEKIDVILSAEGIDTVWFLEKRFGDKKIEDFKKEDLEILYYQLYSILHYDFYERYINKLKKGKAFYLSEIEM